MPSTSSAPFQPLGGEDTKVLKLSGLRSSRDARTLQQFHFGRDFSRRSMAAEAMACCSSYLADRHPKAKATGSRIYHSKER